jgi:hypothetical protein
MVAKLPQLLRRPRVLEKNLIDIERIQFASAVTIDSLPDTGDKFVQLCMVVFRDH